jgi:hypothetical protein
MAGSAIRVGGGRIDEFDGLQDGKDSVEFDVIVKTDALAATKHLRPMSLDETELKVTLPRAFVAGGLIIRRAGARPILSGQKEDVKVLVFLKN